MEAGPLDFVPMRINSVWNEFESYENGCSIAIILPSGTGENIKDVSVRDDEGEKLVIAIPCLESLLSTSFLFDS